MQLQMDRCIPVMALCVSPGQHVLLPVRSSRPNMFVVDPLSGFKRACEMQALTARAYRYSFESRYS